MDLKLGHHAKDGIEIIDVQRRSRYVYRAAVAGTAHRPGSARAATSSSSTWTRLGSLFGSTGLGVLVGGLKWVRAHDGSLNLVCTQQRILKI